MISPARGMYICVIENTHNKTCLSYIYLIRPVKISIMENVKEEFEILYKQAQEYADTRLELLRLQSVDKLSDVVSSVLSRMIVVLFAAMFLVLLSIAAALLIGDLLGKAYYGFFIISGFYALIGLICFFFRHKFFKGPIHELMIKKILNE